MAVTPDPRRAERRELAVLRRTVDELTFLQRLARVSASALDRDDLFALVIRETCAVMHAEVCSLYVVEDGDLVLTATNGLNPAGVGSARMPLGVGITGTVADRGELIALSDASADPRFHWIDGLDQERFTSMCSVPLVSGEARVVGVLNVQTVDPRVWSEDERAALTAIAAQLAGIIERTELHRLLERRLGDQEVLAAAGAELVATLDATRAEQALVAHAARLADPDRGAAALWRPSPAGGMEVAASHALGPANAAGSPDLVAGLVAEVVAAGEARRVAPEPRADQPGGPATPPAGIAAAPLRARRGLLGALALVSPDPVRFRERDLAVVQALANQGALALENAEALAAERRATAHWRRLTEARSDLLSTVSHDVSTPLTIVRTYVEALQERLSGDSRAVTDHVIEELDRIERMVSMVVQSLALEAGAIPLRRRPTRLAALVRDTCAGVQRTAPDHRFAVRVPDEEVISNSDPDTVRRVLQNLLVNALRHAPASSEVEVELVRQDGEASIRVRDHGPGIPADRRETVFERFRRGSERGPGAGIGLFMARAVVEAHGGRVGVDAPAGGGALVWFTLPLAAPPGDPATI